MTKNNYKILKVKTSTDTDTRFKDIKEPLIKPPFLGIINGSVRTGKSNLIMNFLYNNNFYKGSFDKVIFISPTVQNDVTLKHLYEDEEIMKINDGLENIDNILKEIIKQKEEDEDERSLHYLIILDDCLGYIKPKSYLSYLCSRYRHFKTSLLITSQNFRALGPILRINATFYLLFKTTNRKEFIKYEEEFGSLFEHFSDMYDVATKEPYHFLYLDLRCINAYHNFEKKLNS